MDSFVFDSYSVDETGRVLLFRFRSNENRYEERINLPQPIEKKNDTLLNAILFNLHLALGISYWKATCSKKIEINSGSLSEEQSLFWNTIYTKGLGEFYFKNQIDFRDLVHFPYSKNASFQSQKIVTSEKLLVGIGGGKDSVVVWELLKSQKKELNGLLIKTQHAYQAIDELVEKMGMPVITVDRFIDGAFISEAKNHRYNGHVPISMIYAWIGVLTSYLYGYSAFVVANEKSADQGNTELFGMKINHQWSKTKEFEDLFRTYLHSSISENLDYYSPIRHLTELQIVAECIKYPEYLPYITSCNRNFSITNQLQNKKWCGECPKCAFAFIMFAAHLPKERVVALFGKNMIEDESLRGTFMDMQGRGGLKPFECVGTFEEVREAVRMIEKKKEFTVPIELQIR